MRRTLFVLFLAVGASAAPATGSEPGAPKVGFVFATRSASLRETADAGSKEVGKVQPGTRLVFRRVVERGATPSWYRVEPPGGAVGWLAAADASDKRPGTLPEGKKIEVVDSGVGMAKAAGAQTAAARGLSKSATEYAAKNPDFKKAADHFVTLEGFVETQFDDPHLENGDYNDVDVPKRQTHANAFRTGVK